MNVGFTESEYARVRDWLCLALSIAPGPFDESEMLDKLKRGEWLLLTTPNAGCVIEFFEDDGKKAANIILIGGKVGGSLREIMATHFLVCDALRKMGFSYIVGQPRKEWHRFLMKYGFESNDGKEFIKRL